MEAITSNDIESIDAVVGGYWLKFLDDMPKGENEEMVIRFARRMGCSENSGIRILIEGFIGGFSAALEFVEYCNRE